MKKLINQFLIMVVSLFMTANVHAEYGYISGKIVDVTTIPQGLLIMMDTGRPGNCGDTSKWWMFIDQANKAMLANTLLIWHLGKRNVTVYTTGMAAPGYCYVNQVDPVE